MLPDGVATERIAEGLNNNVLLISDAPYFVVTLSGVFPEDVKHGTLVMFGEKRGLYETLNRKLDKDKYLPGFNCSPSMSVIMSVK